MQVSLSSFSSFVMCFLLFASVAWADPTPPPPLPPSENVPIDGGIGYLVAAGIGYGIKKIYDKNKQQKTDNHL
jgi:hypothetical protein